MPIHRSFDKYGPYYQWGTTNKKYYYTPNNYKSRMNALNKAKKQARAILWSQHSKK